MKRSEAASLFAVLRAAYPQWKIDEATPEVYESFLADMPFDETCAALKRLVRTSKWPPSIAEIADAVFRPANSSAGAAWSEFVEAKHRLGPWRPEPQWSSETLRQTVRAMGGWVTEGGVFSWLGKDIPAHRAHFLKLFDSLTAAGATEANIASLEAGEDTLRIRGPRRVGELLPGGER